MGASFLGRKRRAADLPIYIDGNGCTFELVSCGLHSFHHIWFVRARYNGFIRISPTWIETIRKNGTAHLAAPTSCFIAGDAKQPLEHLRDYSHPQAGEIPESDLDLILSDQPIYVTPHCVGTGYFYAGRTNNPPQINRIEHDLFVSAADLLRLKNQPEQETEKNWKEIARECGARFLEEQPNLSGDALSQIVCDELSRLGIKGDRGFSVTAPTIKRHALTGLTVLSEMCPLLYRAFGICWKALT